MTRAEYDLEILKMKVMAYEELRILIFQSGHYKKYQVFKREIEDLQHCLTIWENKIIVFTDKHSKALTQD